MAQKKIQVVLIILLLNLTCFLGVMMVSAYLVAQDKADNEFTVGNNTSTILEEYQEVQELSPGDSIKKSVNVANTGRNSCYVRVLSLLSEKDAEQYARINYNLKDWELAEDGYYYYRDVVKPGESTAELFSQVDISSDLPQEQLRGFKILIYAETVNVEAGGFS
ncbi:MAG: hypothetical protein MJ144_01210 [Clostridia bacterium]|nr:hypothetical protein [Clostridia bacterium]